MPFRFVVSCPDCTGVDMAGCFDGGTHDSDETYPTREEAEAAGAKCVKHGIWEYRVEEVPEALSPLAEVTDGRARIRGG